ncbi:THAP domain-containing protein 4-like [Diaphorina citri]|uniref:THAP domain-containing protein 4-like n=1 Tax=Diaphorina citri TaxID=121845 RepID=A0A1S4E714_DIACI|nr:THAP domain-containing protein 4-like [Diaphorina citri]
MSMNNLQWLKGTWKSISAQGIYPTINSFKYIETLSITQPKNKPYFNYLSNTINNEEIQQPMHCEYGFIRLLPNNSICLQLAHNFGVNTVEKGVLSDVVIFVLVVT